MDKNEKFRETYSAKTFHLQGDKLSPITQNEP